MARNALEVALAALGGGLQGYGRQRAGEQEREDQLKREALDRALRLSGMGFDEAEPLQQRAQAIGQAGSLAGAAPLMPGASAIGRALESAGGAMRTDLERGRRLSVDGKEYVQPFSRTPQGEAQAAGRQAETMRLRTRQDREDQMRLASELTMKEQAAVEEGRRETAVARVRNTGLTPNDRAYQATLQFARTPNPLTGEFPDDAEVMAFAAKAKSAESAVYRTPTSAAPIVTSASMPTESEFRRRRDEAIAAVDARLISTAQKERLKRKIEEAYQADLAKLGPPQ